MSKRRALIQGILHSSHALRNQIRAKAMRLGTGDGLSHARWFVLKVTEHRKRLGIRDVAETLGVTSSAATQLVDGLVQSGFIVRRVNPKDRRSVLLELTKKGNRHLEESVTERVAEMADVFDALTDKELAEYLRLQMKILSKFSHHSMGDRHG